MPIIQQRRRSNQFNMCLHQAGRLYSRSMKEWNELPVFIIEMKNYDEFSTNLIPCLYNLHLKLFVPNIVILFFLGTSFADCPVIIYK